MRFPERVKRTIHVAHIDRSTHPVTYGTPVEYRINVLPTTADSDVETYGVGYSEILQMCCDKTYGKDIKELDLVYVNEEVPAIEDKFAKNADYVVKAKKEGLDSVVFVLDKRVGGTDG